MIIRISYILFFLFFVSTLHYGQTFVALSSQAPTLPQVLKKLKKQKQVSFLYEPECVQNIIIQTPFKYEEDIKTILKRILPPVQLKFKKIGRDNFIIKKKKRHFIKPRLNKKPKKSSYKKKNRAASFQVTGLILDEHNLPLIGATVYAPTHQTGTNTNAQGHFNLMLPKGNQNLHVSYVGYEAQTLIIDGQKEIQVKLKPSNQYLHEVVISALGFQQKRDQLASTSSSISANEILRSGEVSLANALSSKAANVQIARSNGDPGAGTNIRIRGANTIRGANAPLVILDGNPISNSTIYGGGNNLSGGRRGGVAQQCRLSDLNPSNIKNIQILKGASAAALWGSRAANGVLVITTHNGSAGKFQIDYESTFSIDRVHDRIKMQDTWGQGRNGLFNPKAAEAWGDYIPNRAGGKDEYNNNGNYFEAVDGKHYYPILSKNDKTTYIQKNWDEVFRQGGFSQHNLSIRGGNTKAKFYANIGRLDQNGILKNANYDRTNFRLNGKFKPLKWLDIHSKFSYAHTFSNRIQQSSNTSGLLLGLLRTPPDFDNQEYIGTYYDENGASYPNRHRSYRNYLGSHQNPSYNNPVWTIQEQIADSKVNRFIASKEIIMTPLKNWQFILRSGIDNARDKRVYFFPVGSSSYRNPGIYAVDNIKETEINFDAIAKTKFKISQNVVLSSILGWNINDRKRNIHHLELKGFTNSSIQIPNPLNAHYKYSELNNRKQRILSNRAYGILNTQVFDRLFIATSGTLEAASSITGTFFYPSIETAWQFKRKSSNNAWLSFGKLRSSWGKVGIQPTPHRFETLAEGQFSYSSYSDPLDISLFGGGFRIDEDLGNPQLKPEIKTEWETGMDLRFFKDALSFSMTYYQNKIKNLLFYVKLTPSSGYDTQYSNAGSMQNRGIEAEIDYQIIKNSNWYFNLFSNFSKNENKVLHLKSVQNIDLTGSSVSSRAITGYPLGVLYGTGAQADASGKFILDENGFPKLTKSPIILGNPNPDWRGAIGFTSSWKSIGLSLLIEHSQGGDYSPRTQWVLRRFGTTAETANRITLTQDLKNYAGQTISSGSIVRGNIEDFGGGPVLLDESWYRTGIGGGFGDNQAYNFSIKDATFTRLRELSISYTMNSENFKQKTKLQKLTIRLAGRNLFLWDNLQGIDPETNQVGVSNGFGLEYFTNPSTRSFVLTISARY